MRRSLEQFLKRYVRPELSIGLALSGGPDSRALFDLLRSFCGSLFKELHLLHVDHGWRSESQEEAEAIASWAKEGAFPFHLKRLKPSDRNREDAARQERLGFFREVTGKEALHSIFLAHHLDDQVENGLKRFFVSGRWELVKGMAAVQEMEGLLLMRPLLPFSKEEVSSAIQGPFFIDATNSDPSLSERVRIRMQLLPEIKRTFGKEIEAPLFQLLDDLSELEEWMAPQVNKIEEGSLRGPFGLLWRPDVPLPILKLWLRKRFKLSREEERGLLLAFRERRSSLQFGPLFLHRGALIQKREPKGVWHLEEGDAEKGFDALFKGRAAAAPGSLLPLSALDRPELQRVKELRSKGHIPSVLWKEIPVIRLESGHLFDPALPSGQSCRFRIDYRVDDETVMW